MMLSKMLTIAVLVSLKMLNTKSRNIKKQFRNRSKQFDVDSEISLKNTRRSSSNMDTSRMKVLSALKQMIRSLLYPYISG